MCVGTKFKKIIKLQINGPVVELPEGFQGGLMAIAERKPIMGSGAEPELRGPGPPRPPPVIRALQRAQRQSCNTKLDLYIGDVILGWADLGILDVPDMTIC